MNTSENKWLNVLIIILIIISCINLWFTLRNVKTDYNYSLQKDSTIQLKIDSLVKSVNDFRGLYGNDRLLADKEQKIINNYIVYNQKKNELFKNSADSVYNWTKHKLGSRSK